MFGKLTLDNSDFSEHEIQHSAVSSVPALFILCITLVIVILSLMLPSVVVLVVINADRCFFIVSLSRMSLYQMLRLPIYCKQYRLKSINIESVQFRIEKKTGSVFTTLHTLFNGPNKLECFSSANLSCLVLITP